MEEISLQELIEIILKRKYIIISFILICIILSGILSFFVMEPVYESDSSFMATPIDIRSGISPSTTVIYSGDTTKLDSTKKLENKMLGSILSQIRYPQIDVKKMVTYMNSTKYITEALKDLNIDMEKYDYINNIKVGVDTQSALCSISVKYGEANMAIKIKKAMLDYLPEYVLNEANHQYEIIEEIIIQGINRETKSLEEWEKKLYNFSEVAGGIDKLTPKMQDEYQNIYDNYILSNQTLDSYRIIEKEFNYIKSIDIEKMMNVQIVTDDKLPLKIVSPNKALNLAVAFVLGLMISIFLAFFMEYWRKSKSAVNK